MTTDPDARHPLMRLRGRASADEAPRRRTRAAIIGLFSAIVLSLAATLAVIATTTPA